MKIIKLLALAVFAGLFLTGCACKTRTVEPEELSHIPLAEEEGLIPDIHFAFDSNVLSPAGRRIADDAARWLHENPEATVKLEGHCDERGTLEYNMVLGMNRARAVLEYLRSLGVPSNRMTPVSYGEDLPIDPESTEEAWAKNRRVHLSFE